MTLIVETYLCSFCNHFWSAPAGSIDRTKQVRCPACVAATPDPWDEEGYQMRLRGMTG